MQIQNRVARLERSNTAKIESEKLSCCLCRKVISCHSTKELEAILALHCPVHGMIRFDSIFFRPSLLPLDERFRPLCDCESECFRAKPEEEQSENNLELLLSNLGLRLRKDNLEIPKILEDYRRRLAQESTTPHP
jgi:hypothetical protein